MSAALKSLSNEADDAVRDILRLQYQRLPALIVTAPPGSGKTGLIERIAMQSLAFMGERCMIATQTNEQAFELARRLAEGFRNHRFVFLHQRDLPIPDRLKALANLTLTDNSKFLPAGPCIVITNSVMWSWASFDPREQPFDLLLVDEAFQLADYLFHQIAGLSRRINLVGDPGQIGTFTDCDVDKWRSDPGGPHVPCPRALLARHPETVQRTLPVSRRLVPDTVDIVQPAFYPDLRFRSLCTPFERRLQFSSRGSTTIDQVFDRAEHGESVLYVELPALITGKDDQVLAETMASALIRLFRRGASLIDGDTRRQLTPQDVGVICAHISQVNAVRERLPNDLGAVEVETANRFQGLERDVMFVHHPLSGRADATEFHLDAGRLSVMMSRHRVACFLFGREGVRDLLQRHGPSGARVLGVEEDIEYRGWKAHVKVMDYLEGRSRIVAVK